MGECLLEASGNINGSNRQRTGPCVVKEGICLLTPGPVSWASGQPKGLSTLVFSLTRKVRMGMLAIYAFRRKVSFPEGPGVPPSEGGGQCLA